MAGSTRCVACKHEIPAGASLCSVCKSYQRNWMNWLQYFSGIATLVVLIASGTIWMWGKARTALWPRRCQNNLCQFIRVRQS